jgi:uncharacterized protein YbaR (Trm112 family)
MKRDLLAYLSCPSCGGEIRFAALAEFPRTDAHDISEGTLACAGCKAQYALSQGVPRMAGPLESDARKTRDAFAFEWSRYPGSLPEDEPVLLEEAQLPPTAF